MVNKEKIENYILTMDLPFEEIGDGIWIIYESYENKNQKLIVTFEEPLINFRMKVMGIPENKDTHCVLYRHLLELNATELTHGAFAIENNSIILTDSLQTENLDFNEIQASVEAMFLAVINTYDQLSKYCSPINC